MTRDEILNAIRQSAKTNGGEPPNMQLFIKQTGIQRRDWLGKFWRRWRDAVNDAGFMTWDECRDTLAPHAHEAVVMALVAQVRDAVETTCDGESLLGCCWALDAARRWARGETDLAEVEAAQLAGTTSAAAYATADAALDASTGHSPSIVAAAGDPRHPYREAALARLSEVPVPGFVSAAVAAAAAALTAVSGFGRGPSATTASQFARRLGPVGRWAPYCEVRGLGRAGDYLWRVTEGRFITRAELTAGELVALDALLEKAGN